MIRSIFLFIAVLTVSGCTLFQPQVRPDAPIDLPEHYSLYSADEPGPGRWWEAFGSDELNRLVDTALAGNFDVRTAWAKLRQADAVLRQAGADLLPTLDADAGAEKSWTQTKTDSSSRTRSDSKTFSAGLSAAYELDLWGRLGFLRESEALEYEAVREDLDAAAVTVSAEVVTTWIDILSSAPPDRHPQRTDRSQPAHVEFAGIAFCQRPVRRPGSGPAKRGPGRGQGQSAPAATQRTGTTLNALAVLLGHCRQQRRCPLSQSTLPELIALPTTGVPADILAARPDVRAAGLRLKSADWQVSAARADRLPALTLSAGAQHFPATAWICF